MSRPRCDPSHALLEEAKGMLQIEASDCRRAKEGRDPVLLLRDHPTTATAFSALGASRHEAVALPLPTQASRPLWAKAPGCPALHVSRPSDATSPRSALAPLRSQSPRMCTG